MNKRFVILILDGFGMRAMSDVAIVRPNDINSSTIGSIFNDFPDLILPNMEKLGLMNSWGHETKYMHFSNKAVYGTSNLLHYGADTFMGHQEIMGTLPRKPTAIPFSEIALDVKKYLEDNGKKVEIISNGQLRYLLVNDYCTVADNIDADVGMAYNCTAPLDYMSFEEELQIGKLVREVVKVNRVIVFGGKGNSIDDILKAEVIKNNEYIGIHAVKSKSYEEDYHCRHLGFGVDKNVQMPTILNNAGIPVTLIGKVADIVQNSCKSISCVPTEEVLNLTIKELKEMKNGLICTNIQETDLAGHSENSNWYKELLILIDSKINIIMDNMKKNDVLLIMADHGNDPNIGHNQHTREMVPLLIYKSGLNGKYIGERKTLSDVGATVCDFFSVEMPENGTSFLKDLI